jgi:hypothetical protein
VMKSLGWIGNFGPILPLETVVGSVFLNVVIHDVVIWVDFSAAADSYPVKSY